MVGHKDLISETMQFSIKFLQSKQQLIIFFSFFPHCLGSAIISIGDNNDDGKQNKINSMKISC